jgi:hypothetical protein
MKNTLTITKGQAKFPALCRNSCMNEQSINSVNAVKTKLTQLIFPASSSAGYVQISASVG